LSCLGRDIDGQRARIYPKYSIKKSETEGDKTKNESEKAIKEWERWMDKAMHEDEVSK